jgi:hypothetical protein
MKLTKRFAILAFSFLMLAGVFAFSAHDVSAQTQTRTRVIYRPVYVYRPYYNRWYYDPFWRSYYSDPYLEARRSRYYAEQRVARERRDMAEHREKYSADGVITAKERAQMIDDQRQLANAIRDLQRYTSRY